MKALLIMLVILYSCSSHGKRNENWRYADEVDYSPYIGKKIQHMYYCDGCGVGGDLIIIKFEDSTILKVYAYKYTMKIKE